MEKGNPNDPLFLQVLPVNQEHVETPGYVNDPVGDLEASSGPGIIQKYQGRVLLISTQACAIHCRYCFRRNFPYTDNRISSSQLDGLISELKRRTDIHEVILSGGDPLMLNDHKLQDIFSQIESINHIKRIRIHSRLPIVLPDRITPALLQLFAHSPKQIIMIVHANHANEISNKVKEACHLIKSTGAISYNQSVVLKGINDNVDALQQLSEVLFETGIQPYYLHTLDRAKGTAHFAVADEQAKHLVSQLTRRLPGYMVPRLVREIKDQPHKTPLI